MTFINNKSKPFYLISFPLFSNSIDIPVTMVFQITVLIIINKICKLAILYDKFYNNKIHKSLIHLPFDIRAIFYPNIRFVYRLTFSELTQRTNGNDKLNDAVFTSGPRSL